MNRIWANRLEAGDKVWEDVPEERKPAVKEILKEDVVNNKLTKERYKEITGEDYPEE